MSFTGSFFFQILNNGQRMDYVEIKLKLQGLNCSNQNYKNQIFTLVKLQKLKVKFTIYIYIYKLNSD